MPAIRELSLNLITSGNGSKRTKSDTRSTCAIRSLDFIRAFGQHLGKTSPHFVADPRANGGSLFRIYRDVRFSKDKSP